MSRLSSPLAVEDPLAARLHREERRSALARAYRAALRAAARKHQGDGLVIEPPDSGLAAIDAAFEAIASPVATSGTGNPFGALVAALGASSSPPVRTAVLRELRPLLVSTFSYAVPSDQALDRLAEIARQGDRGEGGILEIGAGGGYWARCLAGRGVAVYAYDRTAPAAQKRRIGRLSAHHPIALGGPTEALRAHPRCPTLLLCWPPGISNRAEARAGAPPRYSPMAKEALAGFRGPTLVFVGERSDSFGSPDFFAALDDGWRLAEELPLPNLGSWRDRLQIYRRRLSGTQSQK